VRKLTFVGDEFEHSTVIVQIVFLELFAATAFGFWYFCIADPRRAVMTLRRPWRELLPRSPAASGYFG
jgi:hypothetical protein